MKIQFLGTAAAEGIPALFCQCPVCRHAREAGGKEMRTRSGAIIDGKLKLDFGPDSFAHMQRYGLNYLTLDGVLITHSHSDHLNPAELEFRIPHGCYLPDGTVPSFPLTVYGSAAVGTCIEEYTRHPSHSLAFQEMKPFEPVAVGAYTVTALEAVHCWERDGEKFPVRFGDRIVCRTEDALMYLIEKDGERILYAHDTCEFCEETMAYLQGKRSDLISLDCTGGAWHYDYTGWVGHMTSEGCLAMREKLIAIGAADEDTVFVANHFSHNGYTTYEDIQRITPGFLISYDGLILDVTKKEVQQP